MFSLPATARRIATRRSLLPGSPINTSTPPKIAQRRPASSRFLSSSTRHPTHPLPRPKSTLLPSYPPPTTRNQYRQNSSLSVPNSDPSKPVEDLRPAYQITFTCKPCSHRSSHRITKQGYHHGTVLIQCPSCKNRHVITDHLKVFMDQKSSLEDILRKKTEKGTPLMSLIKKGKLGIRQGAMVGNEGEEDVEFWEDGSESVHERPVDGPQSSRTPAP